MSEIKQISHTAMIELFTYNYWARDRQLEICAALSEDKFLKPQGSSFSSLRDTLVHMLAVEWLWLERWRGNSPKTLLSPDDFPNLLSVRERWDSVEKEMRAFLENLKEEELGLVKTYMSTRGNSWTYPLWQMMYHLLNHQSYHRGQVTTLLRLLNIRPARVDYLEGLDHNFSKSI